VPKFVIEMEATVPDRSKLQLQGLAALVATIALCSAAAVAPLHAKKAPPHEPKMKFGISPDVSLVPQRDP
jgi:hypothetical protein